MIIDDPFTDPSKMSFEEKIVHVFNEESPFCDVLNEATFNIFIDVDYIWNNGYIPWFNAYRKNPSKVYYDVKNLKGDEEKIFMTLYSKNLPSEISKEANKIQPLEIQIGYFIKNEYIVNKNIITLSLHRNAILALGEKGLDNLENAKNIYRGISQHFQKDTYQTIIAHELSHWLNNTLHNNTIKKEVERQVKEYKKDPNVQHIIKYRIASFHEIDAYIHSIANIRKQYSQSDWDSITLPELIELHPVLNGLKRTVGYLSPKNYKLWVSLFFERLSREKLLGKLMDPKDI